MKFACEKWLSGLSVFLLGLLFASTSVAESADPYLWMEEIEGERIDAWIESENEKTIARLTADPRFDNLKSQYRAIFESDERLPGFRDQRQHQGFVYRLFTDAESPRGKIKRASLEGVVAGSPFWETLVDVDAIAAAEDRNWYAYPANMLFSPSGERVIVSFSDGGSDAVSMREFNLETGKFAEGGFRTPLRRHLAVWADDDTLLMATPLDDSEKTASMYPRHIRTWLRGTSLEDAEIVRSIPAEHVGLIPVVFETAKGRWPMIASAKTFSEMDVYAQTEQGEQIKLDVPIDILSLYSGLSGLGSEMIIRLQTDWAIDDQTFPAGAWIAVDIAKVLEQQGNAEGAVKTVYVPANNESAGGVMSSQYASRDAVYLHVLEDVKSRLKKAAPGPDGKWILTDIQLPGDGSLTLPSSSDVYSDEFLVRYESLLTPPSLSVLKGGKELVLLQQVKANVDLSPFESEQHFAISKDGTRVPYFVVHSKDLKPDGSAPVLMYAYGGFGIPMSQSYELPYIGPTHEVWLDKGGVFILANPRGGGEYGPAWHLAAKGTKRQTVYDDIYAVAEDAVKRGLSSPGKFGFIGGSNGGLTAGVLPIQRPDLFGASISLVPLLDMARFHLLLAGASWMDEYGNPDDPVQGPPLLAYSPYQNVQKDADYPEIFFLTSTRDDRVHPGHARKMAKKMQDMGHPALFYEAREGGHGMAVNNEGRAFNAALQVVYLVQKLMD